MEGQLVFQPLHSHQHSFCPDSLALTAADSSTSRPSRAALSVGVFDASADAYVEWEVERATAPFFILFGVVAEPYGRSAPAQPIHSSDAAWMYQCRTSKLHHAGGEACFVADGGPPGRVERVGLLLQAGRLHAYVNGARLRPLSAGATGMGELPARLRFAVGLHYPGDRVRRVRQADWPAREA